MDGLNLSRAFYREYGAPMLEEKFPELLPFLAEGLAGSGSECFGYDDAVSEDHDFDPGFCIFLPGEDVVDRRTAFLLERAYAALPQEFRGRRRQRLSPVGGNRRGVIRIAEFVSARTGTEDGLLTVGQWLTVPEHYLAETVNGELFRDGFGELTEIRSRLSVMPADIRLKKLAGNLLLAAQAGQYNYPRCLLHGETGAAQLAAVEFVRHYIASVFLLNGKYLPFYKWQFRALRELPVLGETAEELELLLTTDNGKQMSRAKTDLTENLCSSLISVLQEQNLTGAVCGDLEKHAYSVNDGIGDAALRNADILAAVS